MDERLSSAIEEIVNVKFSCLNMLVDIRHLAPSDQKSKQGGTYRLIATPMLYSAWERCFTLCQAVAYRHIRSVTTKAQDLSAPEKAVWLQKTPFYVSFVSKLRNATEVTGSSKTGRGTFSVLAEFLEQANDWLANPLDATIEADDLVMTFSNVNPDVVALNAKAIGISDFAPFQKIKLGRLHDLVGSRNDIGHGGLVEPPEIERFTDLWQFTEQLIVWYCDAFCDWLEHRFGNM